MARNGAAKTVHATASARAPIPRELALAARSLLTRMLTAELVALNAHAGTRQVPAVAR
jgi:hypothetical protein